MCLGSIECVCLVLVPAGVLCLCRAGRTMPIGPVSLKPDHAAQLLQSTGAQSKS